MAYSELTQQNPLRVLRMNTESHMGLIISRAGLGKTAILAQIALDAILRGKRVLHVSIGRGIDKIKARYDEILQMILEEHTVEHPHELIDMVNRHRLIMTFQVANFSRSRLEERLHDLIVQDIFRPNVLIVDGFDFAKADRAALEDLKNMTENMGLQAWFSAIRHREDERVSPNGVPAPCHEVDDLFDTVIVIVPDPKEACLDLQILCLNGEKSAGAKGLHLDPTTMMIKER